MIWQVICNDIKSGQCCLLKIIRAVMAKKCKIPVIKWNNLVILVFEFIIIGRIGLYD